MSRLAEPGVFTDTLGQIFQKSSIANLLQGILGIAKTVRFNEF